MHGEDSSTCEADCDGLWGVIKYESDTTNQYLGGWQQTVMGFVLIFFVVMLVGGKFTKENMGEVGRRLFHHRGKILGVVIIILILLLLFFINVIIQIGEDMVERFELDYLMRESKDYVSYFDDMVYGVGENEKVVSLDFGWVEKDLSVEVNEFGMFSISLEIEKGAHDFGGMLAYYDLETAPGSTVARFVCQDNAIFKVKKIVSRTDNNTYQTRFEFRDIEGCNGDLFLEGSFTVDDWDESLKHKYYINAEDPDF
jgi:hypothetical protein